MLEFRISVLPAATQRFRVWSFGLWVQGQRFQGWGFPDFCSARWGGHGKMPSRVLWVGIAVGTSSGSELKVYGQGERMASGDLW